MKIFVDDCLTMMLGAVTLRVESGQSVEEAIADVRSAMLLAVDEAWATTVLIKDIGGFDEEVKSAA